VQPLYNYGNPQFRVFLPKHTIKLLNPTSLTAYNWVDQKHDQLHAEQPMNHIFFEVEMSMTEHELWDYLTKVYEVPIADIRFKVLPPMMGQDHKGRIYTDTPERILARVLLQPGYYFEYPDALKPNSQTGEKQQPNIAIRKRIRKNLSDKAEANKPSQKAGSGDVSWSSWF
jgi:hypothetical protein